MSTTRPGHGSPEDRGGADAWYSRPRKPHYFEGATYASKIIEEADMTEAQVTAYNKGYNEQDGRKEYE